MLADLAGEVDPDSYESWEAWYLRRWREFADSIGFRETLEPVIATAKKSKGMLGLLPEVTVNSLRLFIDSSSPDEPADYPTEKVALLRAETVEDLRGTATSLWRVDLDPNELPAMGCVGPYRAFPTNHAATYFRGAIAEEPTPAGCSSSPMVAFLGTWPWYTGAGLFDRAPGMRWRSVGDVRPGEQAARAMASAWTILGNARVDARQVQAHYDRLVTTSGPLISELPQEPSGPGSLYGRPGGLIRVYLGDTEGRYLNGPLGPLSIRGYNHCIRCFSAFFSLRRAMMRASLTADVKKTLNANPDPCVHGKLVVLPGPKLPQLPDPPPPPKKGNDKIKDL